MNASTIALGISLLFLVIFLLWGVIPASLAKYRAIRYHKSEMNIFGGWLKLILWQPNEGIVVLRNKSVHFIDQLGKGGTKLIFPIRGDEVRARIPLAIRFITWQDEKVLTRESLQAMVKVVVWWRVTDIVSYVFEIHRSINVEGNQEDIGLLQSSEAWLMAITESTIRILISRASVAQLISADAPHYLRGEKGDAAGTTDDEGTSTNAETIAFQLHAELSKKVSGYGISINRVEIQEVHVSAEVQEAINRVRLAFLKPVQSQQEAKARQIELEASARVLGTDAVALIEILKSIKGTSFNWPPPFLQSLFGIVDHKAQNIQSIGVQISPELPEGNRPK